MKYTLKSKFYTFSFLNKIRLFEFFSSNRRAPYQYNVLSNFYKMSNFLYDGSPESYCGSKLYYQLYTTVFNPIKYAVDLSLINTLESKTLNSEQVSSVKRII